MFRHRCVEIDASRRREAQNGLRHQRLGEGRKVIEGLGGRRHSGTCFAEGTEPRHLSLVNDGDRGARNVRTIQPSGHRGLDFCAERRNLRRRGGGEQAYVNDPVHDFAFRWWRGVRRRRLGCAGSFDRMFLKNEAALHPIRKAGASKVEGVSEDHP